MTIIYTYTCSECMQPTRHQVFILACQSCGKQLCKACAIGAMCHHCLQALPMALQNEYTGYLKRRSKMSWIFGLILLGCAVPLFFISTGLAIFLLVIGICAFVIDHGSATTTRKGIVRTAKKIVAKSSSQAPTQTASQETAQTFEPASHVCPKCYVPITGQDKFCPNCGTMLN